LLRIRRLYYSIIIVVVDDIHVVLLITGVRICVKAVISSVHVL